MLWGPKVFFTKFLFLRFPCEEVFLNREQLLLRLAGCVAVQQNLVELQKDRPPLKLLQQELSQFFKSCKVQSFFSRAVARGRRRAAAAAASPTMQNVAANASTQDSLQGLP